MTLRPKLSVMDRLIGGLLCLLNLHTPGSRSVGVGRTRLHSTCARCRRKIAREGKGFWRAKGKRRG